MSVRPPSRCRSSTLVQFAAVHRRPAVEASPIADRHGEAPRGVGQALVPPYTRLRTSRDASGLRRPISLPFSRGLRAWSDDLPSGFCLLHTYAAVRVPGA